jgi:hypothetical protein
MKTNEMGRSCSTYGEKRVACGTVVEKSEGKRQRGIPKHRWGSNMKMDPQEMKWGAWT